MVPIALKKNNSSRYNHTSALKKTGLFSGVDAQTLDQFAELAILRSHPKGKVLFIRDDTAKFFYVIASGWVKLFRETLDGEEAIIDVLNAGHIFGEMAIFENDTYSYAAEIAEDAELIVLPLSFLKQELEQNNQLAMQMFSAMSSSRRKQNKELEHRDLQNSSQRIGCFLLRLCKPDDHNSIVLHLPYDKMLIAARLGMKPETFSRALTRLRDETGIRIVGSTIEMDTTEQLSNYSCNACSSAYPCQNLH